jgi:hypothetical protein
MVDLAPVFMNDPVQIGKRLKSEKTILTFRPVKASVFRKNRPKRA